MAVRGSFATFFRLSGAVALLALTAAPVSAQSMFEQMPTAEAQPPGADPAPAPAPGQSSMMSVPMPTGAPVATPVPGGPGGHGVDCNGIQKTLQERKELVAKANSASTSKQKLTVQQACALFSKLHSNGLVGIKWINTNKEWCSIPDAFQQGFKADNDKVGGIRSKVCGMAAQAEKMQAQAAEGNGGGLLGGPGLSGSFKMPQGAL